METKATQILQIKYRDMQDQRGLEEASAPKLRKKKTSQQKAPVMQKEGNKAKRIQDMHAMVIQNGLKPTKRVPSNEVSPLFQYEKRNQRLSARRILPLLEMNIGH
ncbi:hypothetical protein K7X08_019955 [Anisodus acutangulus]|uniref:Uncharacterized protein n=1 Tax=Anisodus acutangulus TaxID=402998 RepID=A0A9Q1RQ05_9SOLA|nr:hypothetical protein K7X08_019955 [Anisodus acutangulus]